MHTSLLKWSKEKLKNLWLFLVSNEKQKVFMVEVIAGALCGLVAVAFHIAIDKTEHLLFLRTVGLEGGFGLSMMLLVPALGALAAGIITYSYFPNLRGSGIPVVKEAYANHFGYIPIKDTIAKFFACTLQQGSGSSMGLEGPTVMICAGVVNQVSRWTGLPKMIQRRMTAVGVAAGIAAAFNAPLAAVTFSVEEVVGDLDQTILGGVIVAAAAAAVVERLVLGTHPIFTVKKEFVLDHISDIPLYAIVGVVAALFSILFTDSILTLRAWFKKQRAMPAWFTPTIGGLVTGLLAWVSIHWLHSGGVNGGGYAQLNQALDGQLAFKVMMGLVILKVCATVFTYSSGGTGGIFAPVLFMGAMLGGVVGILSPHLTSHNNLPIGAFALLGMGAMFAGVIRAPITSMLIIFEMTGSYGLILPLMIANMLAFGIARHWRPLQIYEALLEQDGIVLDHGSRKRTSAGSQLDA